MTIREYAQSRGISYEAAAKQVRKFKKKELKKHITYQGALTILDDYAVDLLDGHRQPRSVIVAPTNEDIQNEMIRLHGEIDKLKDTIIAMQKESAKMIEENTKNRTLLELADKDRAETQQRLEQAMQEIGQTKQELERYKPTLFGLYKKI